MLLSQLLAFCVYLKVLAVSLSFSKHKIEDFPLDSVRGGFTVSSETCCGKMLGKKKKMYSVLGSHLHQDQKHFFNRRRT